MKYRIKPNPKLSPITRKLIWRRLFGGYLPYDWRRGTTPPVTEKELHILMTRVYDMRREGYSA